MILYYLYWWLYSEDMGIFLAGEIWSLYNLQKFQGPCWEKDRKLYHVLRTNRGGEYNSLEFKEFCEEHGIKRQLTTAYTPQQNGVCERKNRTILNMVQSLLVMSGVPKNFWPEAVNWSIHVLNRSPTFAVQNMTPEEAWSGCKPVVDHFGVFGSIGYAHVPDQRRKKLDDKGENASFLVLATNWKLTNCIILSLRRWLLVEMLSLMKRTSGLGRPAVRTSNFWWWKWCYNKAAPLTSANPSHSRKSTCTFCQFSNNSQ